MTDIIDDSLTWEQRREIRRKKRQELLAEADRIVKSTDQVSSSQASHTRSGDDDDSFDQERHRRRREREEKRRKEREELEKQLKEEDDARAERERKREERRRQREEGDSVTSRYSAKETHQENEAEKPEEEVPEEPEQVENEVPQEENNSESDYLDQNGDKHGADIEEPEDISEDVDEKENEQDMQETEDYQKMNRDFGDEDQQQEDDEEDNEEEIESDTEAGPASDAAEDEDSQEDDEKPQSEQLQERRRERERQRLEEEEREREEAERRKAEHKVKLEREREERARRMAEGEAKRRQLTKQTSTEAKELTVKGNAAATVIMKSDPFKTTSSAKDRSRARIAKPDEMNASGPLESGLSYGETTVESEAIPSTGSRRNKRSRTSLKALEKQAGDLYSFLSELEVQKSAGPTKLKEFLKSTEESTPNQTSMTKEKWRKSSPISGHPTTSGRFRKDQMGTVTNEKEKELKRSPKPPTRSDSMRRLEEAKTKYFHQSSKDSEKQTILEISSQLLPKPVPVEQSFAIKLTPERVESTESLDDALATEHESKNKSDKPIRKDVHPSKTNKSQTSGKLDELASSVEDNYQHLTMKNLNEKLADSSKTHKEKVDTNVAKLSSLDDRMRSYKNKAERQDAVKKTLTPRSGRNDVANRLNMWETGKVATPDKTAKKASDTAVVKQSAGVSSRKNLWETGKVTSSAEKKAASARAEIHGANFASRKNLWLKATQETTKSPGGKPEDTQVIKTGVMTRLNKWEKGEVASPTSTPKQTASNVTALDVTNRRSKWENISHESPSQVTKKAPAVHTMITTEVSSRKTMYESKTSQSKETEKNSNKSIEREPSKSVERIAIKAKRKDSLSSGESDDDHVLSEASDEGQNGQHLELDSGDSDRD